MNLICYSTQQVKNKQQRKRKLATDLQNTTFWKIETFSFILFTTFCDDFMNEWITFGSGGRHEQQQVKALKNQQRKNNMGAKGTT